MGQTIGSVVISYDINRYHTDVKNAMIAKGYFDKWRYGEGMTYNMPNTTLWKQSTSSDQALIDLRSVCLSLGVKIEKAISVLATEFVGENDN